MAYAPLPDSPAHFLVLDGRHSTLVIEAHADEAPLWRYWGPRLSAGTQPRLRSAAVGRRELVLGRALVLAQEHVQVADALGRRDAKAGRNPAAGKVQHPRQNLAARLVLLGEDDRRPGAPAHLHAARRRHGLLRHLDQVQQGGEDITITKRGKPVARLVAVAAPKPGFLFGCMKGSVEILGDIITPVLTPEEWGVPRELLK